MLLAHSLIQRASPYPKGWRAGVGADGSASKGARGRRSLTSKRGWARWGARHEAATRPLGPASRSGQGPRYGPCARLGVPVRSSVCSVGPGGVFCAL